MVIAQPMVRCARGMLVRNTPIENYREQYGLFVKREDLACPPPGPPFSKTRGVYAHLLKRKETVIGVLDTYHSQAGHAVARACQVLGKKCVNFYPEFVDEPGYREPQAAALALGAELFPLRAGRSAVIYHAAKKVIKEFGESGYMMPNALKLEESVDETAAEVPAIPYDWVIIPASSATMAAGVVRGFYRLWGSGPGKINRLPNFIIHLGYTRSEKTVRDYLRKASDVPLHDNRIYIVDEGYQYKDKARVGDTPPWGCNPYYDLKAFRWWMSSRDQPQYSGADVLLWNVG